MEVISVETLPVILVKLSTSPLPPQQQMGGNESCQWAYHSIAGVGEKKERKQD